MANLERNEIGIVGLGAMGSAIAYRLLEVGYRVWAYSRTPEKAAAAANRGAVLAKQPREVVRRGGLVITMVADDDALEEITTASGGILGGLGSGGVHLCMSTVSPECARLLARLHAKVGELYVSAPVFGRPNAAAAGRLWALVSGDLGGIQRAMPVLESITQRTFSLGEDPGLALVAKLAGNVLIVAAIEAMAEVFALAEKNNVDAKKLFEVFSETFLACPVYQNYGRIIAAREFTPAGMRLSLGLKDVFLALAVARKSLVPMPLLSLIHERLLASVSKGRGGIDWAGLALETFEDCNLIAPAPEPMASPSVPENKIEENQS